MTQKFKIGDKVQLITEQSPIMAVEKYNEANRVLCVWYSEYTHLFETTIIGQDCLILVD